jgi:hypothetical protein
LLLIAAQCLQGYQFVCATERSYWLHWDTVVAVNPDAFTLHKMDLLNATAGWLYLLAKWPQVGHQHCSPTLSQLTRFNRWFTHPVLRTANHKSVLYCVLWFSCMVTTGKGHVETLQSFP